MRRLRKKEGLLINGDQFILYCDFLTLLIFFNPITFIRDRPESHVPRFGDAYLCYTDALLRNLNIGNPHVNKKSPECLKRVSGEKFKFS